MTRVGYSVGVPDRSGSYVIVASQSSKKAARAYARRVIGGRVFRGGTIGQRIFPRRPNVSKRKARVILHHGEVGGHPLTEKQRRFFGARASGYPVRNPHKKLVLIYGRVLSIDAQKTQPHRCDSECVDFQHKYRHVFKKGAKMYGLPNGDILITTR